MWLTQTYQITMKKRKASPFSHSRLCANNVARVFFLNFSPKLTGVRLPLRESSNLVVVCSTFSLWVARLTNLLLKMNSVIALLICAVAIASVCATPPKELGDDAQWNAWKSVYEKKYENEYVDNYRKWIWQANLKVSRNSRSPVKMLPLRMKWNYWCIIKIVWMFIYIYI